ncbi:hypothetical protein IGJ41_000311 [Enterococcus sp. DIV1537a]|uniref:hypothetical protein n=1 Tax=Enterococcus sp. DIV1537a TaxID=2774733 RepID=UPI003F1F2304
MKIAIKNRQSREFLELLHLFSGQKRQARALARFVRLITKVDMEIESDKRSIFREFCVCDGEGEIVTTDNGEVTWLSGKKERGVQEIINVLEDESIIDLTEFENYFDDFVDLLENEAVTLNGKQAQAYDELLEILERVE